jgi:hypothetical protein
MSHPDVGLVYGNAVYTNEHDQVVGEYHARPFHRARYLHVSSIPQPTAFMRRHLFELYGGLDVSLHYALDFEFFLRLMWKTTFLHTGRLLATYRLHGTSKTVSGSVEMLAEAIDVVRRICDQHAGELPGVKRKAVSDWWWCGAMNSLDARAYRQALKYALFALHTYPLRPRMATFGLKVFDTVFRTQLTERAISFLDRRAYWLSLQSNNPKGLSTNT